MTKEEILKQIEQNENWEPNQEAPPEVWDLYYDILDEMEESENDDDDSGDEWDDEDY